MSPLFQRIAKDMDMQVDDEFIMAVEGACITTPEYDADPQSCQQRVHGALEELYDFDL